MDMPYNRQLHFENSGVLLIALADKIAKSFGGRVLYSGATLQSVLMAPARQRF